MNKAMIATAALILSSCGGGGSGGSLGDSGSGITANDPTNNGCSQEFYQTIIGSYSGSVLLNDGDNSRTPRVCQWDASVEISGQSILTRCVLRTTTLASVEQSTFYPDDDTNRYQCIEDQGERTVSEPIGTTFPITELPGLDNSLFPIDIDFSANRLDTRGPYFGDENVSAIYEFLYDGIIRSNVVQRITVNGDGTLTYRDNNGEFLGTLRKE